MADPQWQHKVLKASKTALKSSIVAAAAAAGGTYKGHKLSKKEDAKKAGKKYTQGLLSRKWQMEYARESISQLKFPPYCRLQKVKEQEPRDTH